MRSSIFVAATLFSLVACQSQPPSMSVEEATKITADFQDQGFVPPPRAISDITAILERAKPDAAALAMRRAVADAPTPPNAPASFYYQRGQTLRIEGRIEEAIADLSEAVRLNPSAPAYPLRLGDALLSGGYMVEAAQTYVKIKSGTSQGLFAAVSLASIHMSVGDYEQADRDLDSAHRQYESFSTNSYATAMRSAVEFTQGRLSKLRGNYVAAESLFRLSMADTDWIVAHWNPAWGTMITRGDAVSGVSQKDVNIQRSVNAKRQIADVHRLQGKLNEAEYWSRRALVQSIELLGVNSPTTNSTLSFMSLLLADQGRYAEAQQLAEITLAKVKSDNPRTGSAVVAELLDAIGRAAIAQAKTQEALDAFGAVAKEMAASPELGNQFLGRNLDYAIALRGAGRIDDALRVARAAVDWQTRTLGPASPSAVIARGYHASFLATARDPGRALAEFQAVMPQLMSLSRSASASGAMNLSRKAQELLGEYVRLLATMRGTSLEQRVPDGVATETFRIADLARGQVVQQALIESGARAAITDKALADLARREQDTWHQISARERVLADAQALATNQQDSQALERLHGEVEQLRVARTTLRAEIERRFPSYARMTEPRSPSLEEARAALAGNEALVAIYAGEQESYVWALRKTGDVAFAAISLSRDQLAQGVGRLRRAVDSSARTLGELPAFDVALAHQLYAAILQPVEAGWKGAKTLITVPHGPLAQLPFALLMTRPVAQPKDVDALFSGYRDLPYLVRDVAVTQVPSVAALIVLRGLPAASPNRRAFVGFGDPWFSAQQAAQARRENADVQVAAVDASSLHLRSAPATEGLASATLADLPRLPDTAAEVREVALALHADLNKDVYLGAAASERQVRTMKLDDRRVVMFATHGLVPGDLDGLSQPALALTAPGVANVEGDGLLTMEKILGLKLDADWVVLSACNTAAGSGAGADAVSGLGRAFFYAGARALLVTHWPVESTSARLLTTTTFRRQAADARLTRADALRESMLGLIDGPGRIDPTSGKIVHSYAHPIFWAPFALVGDGR